MSRQGYTLPQIQKETGISRWMLGKLRKERGVEITDEILKVRNRIPREVEDEILHLSALGFSITEIPELVDVHKSTVVRVRNRNKGYKKKYGLTPGHKTRKVSEEVEDAVIRDTENGFTTPDIARRNGISTRTVQRIRARRKVDPIYRGRKPSWTIEDIESSRLLLEDGASYRDASQSFGVPKSTLRERFPGFGFEVEDTARVVSALRRAPEDIRQPLLNKARTD